MAGLDPEPPLLLSHIDCVTARAIAGWAFWTQESKRIDHFEVFVDFLPVEVTVRRWRREDLASQYGIDDEICFELGVPSDMNGATVSIRADGGCALFMTGVRPSYFLTDVKRLHRGSLAVVGVSPVHDAGVMLVCGGRSYPQLAHPFAVGAGATGAAFFVLPAVLLDDPAKGFSLRMPSQPSETYPVLRT
jgi:hypothetical protein